jgi:hypothetical protein
MTALCPGAGPSGIKSQYGNNVYIAAAGIAAALNNVPVIYAVPFASLITATTLDLVGMCATDPPAQPVMSNTDWLALIGPPGLPDFTGAQAKFNAWVRYFLWFQFCECTSAATPAPTVPAAPSILPTINPTLPGNTGAPCGTRATPIPDPMGGTSSIAITSVASIPDNVTLGQVTFSVVPGGTNHPPINFEIFLDDWLGNGKWVFDQVYQCQSGGTITVQFAVPQFGVGQNGSAAYLTVHATAASGVSDDSVTMFVNWYCNGATPGVGNGGCCPPDPAIQGQLDQILKLVTLIQRQAVPFAYITGTVHAGLTGAGALSISGLLGVKVSITALPTSLGVEGTSPPQHFDVGTITFGTIDGFPSSYRIEHNPQVIMPCLASAFTDLDYELTPGVTITVTELVREP